MATQQMLCFAAVNERCKTSRPMLSKICHRASRQLLTGQDSGDGLVPDRADRCRIAHRASAIKLPPGRSTSIAAYGPNSRADRPSQVIKLMHSERMVFLNQRIVVFTVRGRHHQNNRFWRHSAFRCS